MDMSAAAAAAPVLVDARGLARVLSLSHKTVYELAASVEGFPRLYIGTALRFNPDEVLAFIRAHPERFRAAVQRRGLRPSKSGKKD